jgi:cold-inducible RNA-binding protein
MGNKLYVGNLSFGIGNDELKKFFEPCGTVVSATVITDRMTGQSKGFGFVEMSTDQEAQAGIAACNGKEVEGRTLTVNEARPRTEGRGGRSGGSRGFRGGYGGGRHW